MFRDAELWGDAGGLPGGGSAELGPAGWMGRTGMGEQRGSVGEWVGAGTAQAEPQKWAEAGLGDMGMEGSMTGGTGTNRSGEGAESHCICVARDTGLSGLGAQQVWL